MLAQARASGVQATWLEADIGAWTPDGPLDLIYANAALQWLGEHAPLLPRLLGRLRADGVLAVQMPRNFEAPSHALLRETARSRPWADRLAGILDQLPVAGPDGITTCWRRTWRRWTSGRRSICTGWRAMTRC